MAGHHAWAFALTASVSCAFAACGGSTSDSHAQTGAAGGMAGNGGNGGVAATDGGSMTGGSGGSVTGGGGIPISDSGPLDVASSDVVLADAAWFDCGGCACDGSTHYCVHAVGGALSSPPPPDAAPCEDAGAWYKGCHTLPETCPSPPTCDCVPMVIPGACSCSDIGGGLLIECYFP